MRKVYLDELPRYEEGTYKDRIDWSKTIGMWVGFVYNDIYGKIQITRYDKKSHMLTIQYEDRYMDIFTGNFTKCQFGKILGARTNEFKVGMNQVFKDDNGRDLTIIDRKYIKNKRGQNCKWYKYTCNKCGWTEGWIVECSLLRGSGCACCCSNHQTVVEGINDITTTAPWMIDLGVDKEEAKKFTNQSDQKIKVKCPHCSAIMYKKCSHIYKHKSIGCTNCGDGISYPEKFVGNILTQLGIEFETQYMPKWVGRRFYDFYIPSLNTIIETHGIQHYKESTRGRSLQEEQENDKLKKELALENGVYNYIVLDCRYSELECIKNSTILSELNELFDLSQVDFVKSDEIAIYTNIKKQVCDYWNNKEEWETTTDLGKKFNLDRHTISSYLKQGSKLGWCNYDTRDEQIKNNSKNGKLKGKKVEVFNFNNKSLGVFDSCAELERQSEELFGIKLLHSAISMVCKGKQKSHKGYIFKYV